MFGPKRDSYRRRERLLVGAKGSQRRRGVSVLSAGATNVLGEVLERETDGFVGERWGTGSEGGGDETISHVGDGEQ